MNCTDTSLKNQNITYENKHGCVNFLVNSAILEFLSTHAYFWLPTTTPICYKFSNQKYPKSWELLAALVGQKNNLTVPNKGPYRLLRFLILVKTCLGTFLGGKKLGSVLFPPLYSQLDQEGWQKHPSRDNPWHSSLPSMTSWCPAMCRCNSILS